MSEAKSHKEKKGIKLPADLPLKNPFSQDPVKTNPRIALVGNPNSGKSSLFNHLTGLNQKVGNFSGVTVEKKTGKSKINDRVSADIIDLPGLYSLYPHSADEEIVFDFLFDKKSPDYPDLLLVIADASNLKRNLFLFSQLYDLGLPVILVLTMTDVAKSQGLKINPELLRKALGVPVVEVNARTGKNLFRLKECIANPPEPHINYSFDIDSLAPELIRELKTSFGIENSYFALQLAHQYEHVKTLSKEDRQKVAQLLNVHRFNSRALQISETMNRYAVVDEVVREAVSGSSRETFSDKLDRVLTHPVWGYFIFFGILFLMFQAIFAWATVPMDLIDSSVGNFSEFLKIRLPKGPLTDLLTDGVVSGLGGILIFIPQIAILFAFISVLEETGYMARVMFIMDRFMRRFGMNGKSVVPLISGFACAVPAIMSTRSIDNPKERLITIFVTPFMSCSARIPVYTILIALVIPSRYYFGLINLQGLVLMGLYLMGFSTAVVSGWVMHKLLHTRGRKSFFILELPSYKMPRWKNVGLTIWQRVRSFVFEAGKVILAISIVLWVLASYGPPGEIEKARQTAMKIAHEKNMTEVETQNFIASDRLEHSYAGHFGKMIAPVIHPLGFDWKIGVALITSFAAREVFVGTMATIYSIGESAEVSTLKERMRKEIDPISGKPFYSLPLGISLLLFYAFAMQCMSTLAVVYRETKGWKWPVIQFLYMTSLAYIASFTAYHFLTHLLH